MIINHINLDSKTMDEQEKTILNGLSKAQKPQNIAALKWRLSTIKQLRMGQCSIAFKKQLDEWMRYMPWEQVEVYGDKVPVVEKMSLTEQRIAMGFDF